MLCCRVPEVKEMQIPHEPSAKRILFYRRLLFVGTTAKPKE